MLPVARLMDIGVGIHTTPYPPYAHPDVGYIMASNATVLTNSMPTATMLDTVITADGGVGIIVGGSSKCFVNSMPLARMTDIFVGTFTGTIVGGSSSVFSM